EASEGFGGSEAVIASEGFRGPEVWKPPRLSEVLKLCFSLVAFY
ncbi:hypothetical protein A2U01_0100003, partial [Trifolium medium]|nr:hypothetical protein [Trifolium medium]